MFHTILHGLKDKAASNFYVREMGAKIQDAHLAYNDYVTVKDDTPNNPELERTVNTPRTIELSITENAESADEPLTFYVFGCGGDGSENQKTVARMLNDIAAQNMPPHFCIMLGDNFYDNGLDTPDDPGFKEKFDNVYHRADYPFIADLPYFVIMGNHDHNLHGNFSLYAPPGKKQGKTEFKKIASQVQHTFIHDKENVYAQDKIDLLKLPRWNMPSHFYKVIWKNIEMFFIDSNTYVKDFLAMSGTDPNNQASWLQENAQNPDTIKLIFMHHPLITVGRRAFKNQYDTQFYLSEDDLKALATQHNINVHEGYNAILRQVLLIKQQLVFDTVFSAHDHVMSYHLDRTAEKINLCQITAGGGGGSLQDRCSAQLWEKMPFFSKSHGFVNVTVHPEKADKKIQFDFHYIQLPLEPSLDHSQVKKYRHLRFDNLGLAPQRAIDPRDALSVSNNIERLRAVFLEAYSSYLIRANTRQEGEIDKGYAEFHGAKGLVRADNLRNLFNNVEPLTLVEYIELLSVLYKRYTTANNSSLSTIFEMFFKFSYEMSFDDFKIKYTNPIVEAPASPPEDDTLTSKNSITSSPFLLFQRHGSKLSLVLAAGDSPPASVNEDSRSLFQPG
jgi:hypothetical protein